MGVTRKFSAGPNQGPGVYRKRQGRLSSGEESRATGDNEDAAMAVPPVSDTGHAPSLERPPASNQDLILQMWNALDWPKAVQVSLIVLAAGLAVGLTFAGIGLLAHLLFGMPTMWSVLGGATVGSATAAGAYKLGSKRPKISKQD